jgi:hypothetical protein
MSLSIEKWVFRIFGETGQAAEQADKMMVYKT